MTAMVMSLDDVRVIARCRVALGLPAASRRENLLAVHTDERAGAAPVMAAALRAAIWAESRAGVAPVHTTRVFNHAIALARPAHHWPDDVCVDEGATASDNGRVTLRNALADLADHGDVARLPGGYWLPAPLRIVKPGQLGHALLIGGRPTPFLPDAARERIDHLGPSRLIRLPLPDWARVLPEQPEEAWLQRPVDQQPLEHWARRIVDETPLSASGTALSGTTIHLYRPDRVATGAPQLRRWMGLETRTTHDPRRFLSRQQSRMGWQYQIVRVQHGTVLETGELPTSVEVRRLLYGLDAAAETPTSVTRLRAGQTSGYEIRSELPAAERRLLRALGGELTIPSDGNYYPRCWTVRQELGSRVEQALGALGVKIQMPRAAGRW